MSAGNHEVVDLARGAQLFRVPVEHWMEDGLPMTQKLFAVAPHGVTGVPLRFAPDERARVFAINVDAR